MRSAHGVSSAAVLGMADEDLAAARRIPDPGRIERPVDREPQNRAAERHLAQIELVDAGAPLFIDERDRDALRARRHAQTEAPMIIHRNAARR